MADETSNATWPDVVLFGLLMIWELVSHPIGFIVLAFVVISLVAK